MKNTQKKFLSAVLAASSVAGVVAPAVTAFAATTTEVETFMANLKKDMNFYSWNVAYGAVVTLPTDQQGTYLDQLAKLESTVKTETIKTILAKIDEFYKTQNVRIYDEIVNVLIPKVPVQQERDYLASQLSEYGKPFYEKNQPDYPKATDAIIAVDNAAKAGKLAEAKALMPAADAAIAKITGDNNTYLKELLNEVVTRNKLTEVNLAVSSVKATKVNILEVKFNKAVDTADVTVAVTKTGSAVEASVAWNADKTVATITTTAKMTAGAYTVTATSKADATVKVTGTTEVKSQYVAEIKLLNDVALTGMGKTSTGADLESGYAYVYYDVFDQYGESLRTSTNIEWSSSVTKAAENRTTGMLTLKRSDDKAFTYGEKIYLTGVYTKTGVTVTKTVDVGAKQALNSVEVAGYVKKGTSEIVKTLPSGFKADTYYMVYNVKDQNGNYVDINEPVKNNDVTFVSDNVLLVKELTSTNETKLTIGDKEYNAVFVTPGINVGKGGEVNITAIANKTGNKTVVNTSIGEDNILTSFTMSAPTSMIADGEDVEIPFEALDQNGGKMTNFVALAKQTTFNKLTFNISTNGTLKLYEKADGTAVLKYSDPDMEWSDSQSTDGIDRTVSLTSVVVGGNTSGQLIYIQDKARPDAISAVDFDNVLVEKGTDLVSLSNFDFLDQYGRKMAKVDEYKGDKESDNTSNKNGGYIYDNKFFKASKAGSLKGNDFAGYDFIVRATFKGDTGYLTANGTALAPDNVLEISTDAATTSAAIAADNTNDVLSAKTGLSFKFEIAKYKDGKAVEDAQATSTAKSEAVTVVDIKSVKGYTIADLNKFFVSSAKSNDSTGDAGAVQLAIANINNTLAVANSDFKPTTSAAVTLSAAEALPTEYEQKVKVTGTYNGETVNIPAAYLKVEADKLAASGATKDGYILVDEVKDASIKWSDLYDATTARYVRKDAADTLKVTVLDAASAVVDTVSKAIAIADAAPKATVIEGPDTLTIDPDNTVITVASSAYLDGKLKINSKEYKIKDQYGVVLDSDTAAVDTLAPTYKVASIVQNAAGYADNNFTVAGNDTAAAAITGAERGDTFIITIKAGTAATGYVTKDVTVTVGADKKANITNSTNNYLDDLIKNKLETQRTSGLN